MNDFEIERSKQIENGTYTDDGNVPVKCKYCGKFRPILSVYECCDEARKEQKAIMDECASLAVKFLKDLESK